MKRAALSLAALAAALAGAGAPAFARTVVDASSPQDLSVTVYRDPDRNEWTPMNRNWPRGFAMVSETRKVTLPPGESTIRFEGVAEGMVAVSAIVTGLPGGTIEKNRNADLLSPASLVDGTLGNRVTLTRTNPATGQARSEQAVIRTRADGGLVLQTQEGFEAVRCSGLPESLTFDRVPAGLSAQPVFSIDTRDDSGGTYQVVLTYISWGFDWQAHYVGTLAGQGKDGKERLRLRSWLTLLNDNGQSFDDAQLLAVAGELNIVSDFQQLSDPPDARPLRLSCYPLGSTAAGSPVPDYSGGFLPPPPPPMAMAAPMMEVVVTAARGRAEKTADSAVVLAEEEQLGDLKLYRVPAPVTVAAKSLKQVAFLDREDVKGEFQYRTSCSPWEDNLDPRPMRMLLLTTNDRKNGLGVALPMGGITLFETSSAGDLLVGEERLRDYAEGQDVEIALGESGNAFSQCRQIAQGSGEAAWTTMQATLSNANSSPIAVRIELGSPGEWKIRQKLKGQRVKDGNLIVERTVPAGGTINLKWDIRSAEAED